MIISAYTIPNKPWGVNHTTKSYPLWWKKAQCHIYHMAKFYISHEGLNSHSLQFGALIFYLLHSLCPHVLAVHEHL